MLGLESRWMVWTLSDFHLTFPEQCSGCLPVEADHRSSSYMKRFTSTAGTNEPQLWSPGCENIRDRGDDWHDMWYRRDPHVLTVVCFWEGAGDNLCEKLRDRCHSKLVRRLLRKCDNNLHFLSSSHHWPGKTTTKQTSVTVTGYLYRCLTCKWWSAFRGLNCRYLNTYIKLKLIELAILIK